MTRPDRPAAPSPLVILGAPDALSCEGDSCAVPAPAPVTDDDEGPPPAH